MEFESGFWGDLKPEELTFIKWHKSHFEIDAAGLEKLIQLWLGPNSHYGRAIEIRSNGPITGAYLEILCHRGPDE